MLACVELGQEASPAFTDVARVCVFLSRVTLFIPPPRKRHSLRCLPMILSFQITLAVISALVDASFHSVNARKVILTLTREFFFESSPLVTGGTGRPSFTSFPSSSSSVALRPWRLVFLAHLGAVNKFMAQRGNYAQTFCIRPNGCGP